MLIESVLVSLALSAAPDLSKAPPLPPKAHWLAPVPQQALTKEGSRVVVLSQPSLPMVHLTVVIDAGSELDPSDKPGLSAAVALMLEEGGSNQRSPQEMLAAIDDLGGELVFHTDQSSVRILLSVMSNKLPAALDLLTDLIAKPRFLDSEWPQVKARRLAEIQRENDDPREVADQVFNRVLFADHPFGRPVLGTKAGVEKISLDDVRSFYAAHYGPRAVSFLLIGDATLADATKRIEAALGHWPSSVAAIAAPTSQLRVAGKLVLVDRPGAAQSEVRVGHVGARRTTSDYAALTLLETLLGGSFTSRLNQNLREKHGYTYGAHAKFTLLRSEGPFDASAAVRTDVTAESIKEMISEMRAIQQPIGAEELAKGRSLVASKIIEAHGDGLHASLLLSDLLVYRLPLDTYGKLPDLLAQLDGPAVAAAAHRLFFPDSLIIVVVGDRRQLEPSLKALDQDLEVRDTDGNLLSSTPATFSRSTGK